jgi:hypothetical protein
MRYVVGIDLGTTHCALAYSPIDRPAVRQLDIPQLVAPGEVAARPLLPSFLYLPAPGELDPAQRALPWGEGDLVIGAWAQRLGAASPGRLVASSKSWICHGGVNRKAAILPWSAPDDAPHISPFQASVHLLAHLKAAWDHAHEDAPLAEQEVVITVPASFDEVARELTVQAAHLAGLPKVRLLEEPQAALYHFLGAHHDTLDAVLGDARLALVVDVGGGTTDLTLVRIAPAADGQPPEIERIAVGGHLMLGGDNMDAALAHLAQARAQLRDLDPTEWSRLVQGARRTKEELLGPHPPDKAVISIQRRSSRLIGGTKSVEITREAAWELIVDGFVPRCGPTDVPERSGRAGLTQLGLPYETDPAIPRHVCAFLRRHALASAEAGATVRDGLPRPDLLLLNGGVFAAQPLVERFTEVLDSWFERPVRRLPHTSLDTAVSRGAVRFAMAGRGWGLLIAGGAARAYYVGVDDADGVRRALCVAPRGMEEGSVVEVRDRVLELTLGQPVAFDLFSTTADRPDEPGQVVAIDDDLEPLPRVTTALAARSGTGRVPVTLATELTEGGTLELSLVTVELPPHRWRLAFDLGPAAPAPAPQAEPRAPAERADERIDEAAAILRRVFGVGMAGRPESDGKQLRKELERVIGPRGGWSSATCRAVSDVCLERADNRGRTAAHELSWMRLMGWGLRPGLGMPGDDGRVAALWALRDEGLVHPEHKLVWTDWWVMWRRVAAGLAAEAQRALFDEVAPWLSPQGHRPQGPAKGGAREMMHMVAVLERLDPARKAEAGAWCLARFRKVGSWWALGRLGSRTPVVGDAEDCVAVEVAEAWLARVLDEDWREASGADFAAVLLAARTGDAREVSDILRARALDRLREGGASPHWLKLVSEGEALGEEDERALLGESLPSGLRLRAR